MSDFYLCKHKEPCCGKCIRGVKTENYRLESRFSEMQTEYEKLKREAGINLGLMREALDQRDSLQKQVQQMLAVVEAAEKLVVHCNHKPEGWDNLDKALAEFRGTR